MASQDRAEVTAALARAARLARIGLQADEARALAPEFGALLNALSLVADGSVADGSVSDGNSAAERRSRPLEERSSRTRPDEEHEPLGRARLLPLAPETSGDFYRVPRSSGGPR